MQLAEYVSGDMLDMLHDGWSEDIETVVVNGVGKPEVLDGPHHGAPQDYKPANPATKKRIEAIGASRVYISVGSWNGYKHPKRKYIKDLVKNGCKVSCSQLTCQCRPTLATDKRPVLSSHALLGLRSPRTGVACRGAMRYTVRNGSIVVDEWDQDHCQRVKDTILRPACRSGLC